MRALRLLCALALVGCLAERAFATWSIVVVNTRTGEVGVAGATCLGGDLERLLPVVVPGIGGGCAQSSVDVTAQNRLTIRDGLLAGFAPADILVALALQDPQHQQRQYGIVNLADAPVTFTGFQAGLAKPSLAGVAGEYRYAMQGNVLTGDEVILAAELVFLSTDGDLSQRLLAAMQAARNYGGDGRCSCNWSHPTQCGAPPPDFDKSAHSGFMIVARIGDALGECTQTLGCATATYYMDLNVKGKIAAPDPIRQLDELYQLWRASMQGLVDQVHSRVELSKPALVANGTDSALVRLRLGDLERARILHGGHALRVEPLDTPAPVTTVGTLVDHGDGTYEFPVTAGLVAGVDTWRVIVTENGKDVVLQPDVVVTVAAPGLR